MPFRSLSARFALILALAAVVPSNGTDARARSEAAPTNATAPPSAAPSKDPLVIVVSLKRQRLTVHGRDGVIAQSPISSGNSQFPTITGVFSIIGKSVDHESNIYEGAEMPYMQRLTWTGTAMHAGHLPGYPASHGCIRLPYSFSQRLYDMTTINTRVIVSNGDIVPQTISHPKLMAPALPDIQDTPVSAAIGSRVASLSGIGAAYAAPRPLFDGEVPLTAAAKQRFAETQLLYDAIRPAEDTFNATTARVKASTKVLSLARIELAKLDDAASEARGAIAKIHRTRDSLAAELTAIGRKAATAKSDKALEDLARAEDTIEARLFELADKLQAAEEAMAAVVEARPALRDKIEGAEEARRAVADEQRAALQSLRDARAAFNLKKREDARYMRPVSVLVSRKDQKLYVRQGFEPVLEAPITIDNPEAPLGTHVFTAMGYREGGAAIDWSVVSPPTRESEDAHQGRRAHLTAVSALDRVQFPAEALAAITERIKPGSSIIISDETTSKYFGAGTDFTINTR